MADKPIHQWVRVEKDGKWYAETHVWDGEEYQLLSYPIDSDVDVRLVGLEAKQNEIIERLNEKTNRKTS